MVSSSRRWQLVATAVVALAVAGSARAVPSYKEVSEAVAQNPNDLKARVLLARYYETMQRWADALDAWTYVVGRYPKLWNLHVRVGVVRYRMGGLENWRLALRTWRDVMRRDPGNERARRLYALVKPRYDEARAAARRGGSVEPVKPATSPAEGPLTPDQAEDLYTEGMNLFCNEKFAEAAARFERVAEAKVGGRVRAARVALGECLIKDAQDPDRALLVLEGCLKDYGDDAKVLFLVGCAWGLKGEFARQVESYEKSLLQNEDDPETHFQLALACDRIKRFPDVTKHAQLAVQKDAAYKKRLQPLIQNSVIGREIARVIEDVLAATEGRQLTEAEIDGFAGRVGELLGEENVDPEARSSIERFRGLAKDPAKRRQVADMLRGAAAPGAAAGSVRTLPSPVPRANRVK